MTISRKTQRGHTLLELAISAALGMLIVIATISLYRGQRLAYDRATEAPACGRRQAMRSI